MSSKQILFKPNAMILKQDREDTSTRNMILLYFVVVCYRFKGKLYTHGNQPSYTDTHQYITPVVPAVFSSIVLNKLPKK